MANKSTQPNASWKDKKADPLSVLNKQASADWYMMYQFNRMQAAFQYEGLPETIPQDMLERYIMLDGICAVAEVDGSLYALPGKRGGKCDPYFRGTRWLGANPWLGISYDYEIGKECEVIRNDSSEIGLLPLFERYSSLMAENLITIRSAEILMRMHSIITVSGDSSKKAAELYLQQIEEGKIGCICDPLFTGGDNGRTNIQTTTGGSASYITQIIELQQYLDAKWYNDIGIDANWNSKREVLNDGESEMNSASLLPLFDDMLNQRKRCLENINKMFGTSISVSPSSSWEVERKDVKEEVTTDAEPV